MTLFHEVKITCAVCGHTDMQTVLISSSAIGAPDLDSRPPPLMRMTLPMQIQCCPSCGYCARDISKTSVMVQTVVTRHDYRDQLRDKRFSYLANMFLSQCMIQEATGDYADAGWAAMRAAWACDDGGEEYTSAAAKCRARAVALFDEARMRGQSFAAELAAEEAILSDLLRRGGRFAEAEAVIQRGLTMHPEDTMRCVLLFQRYLCRRQDVAAYTVAEALNHVAGAGDGA